MRNVQVAYERELQGTGERIQAALDAAIPNQPAPLPLPKPQPVELIARWSLQPAPQTSPAYLAALKRQAAWEAQAAERAAERVYRDRGRATDREARP